MSDRACLYRGGMKTSMMVAVVVLTLGVLVGGDA